MVFPTYPSPDTPVARLPRPAGRWGVGARRDRAPRCCQRERRPAPPGALAGRCRLCMDYAPRDTLIHAIW